MRGLADAIILQREGKVALRRHRLQRLIAEVQAQGAASADADLARALGVNARISERDMGALRAESQPAPTRRQRRSILSGYSPHSSYCLPPLTQSARAFLSE